MHCPSCGHNDTSVKDSRSAEQNHAVRRRRLCLECNYRFTTFERTQRRLPKVVKKHGLESVLFDRDKLFRSLELALNKRRVDAEHIELIVNDICQNLEMTGESHIKSEIIGEMVMENLSKLDSVAYVRYASVYYEFNDPEDFNKFLNQLNKTMIAARSENGIGVTRVLS